MEGHCSTGQSPHWAVVPMEEEEEEDTFHWIAIFNSGFISIFKPCPMDFEYENFVHFTPTTVIVT